LIMKLLDNKYFKTGLTIFLTTAAIMLLYFLVFHLSVVTAHVKNLLKVISPVTNGMILAYLLSPIVNFAEKSFYSINGVKKRLLDGQSAEKKAGNRKIVRAFTILIVYLLFFLFLFLLFRSIIPQLIDSLQGIIRHLPKYWGNLQITATKLLAKYPDLEEKVLEFTDSYTEQIERFMKTWDTNLMSGVGSVVSGNGEILTKVSDVFASVTSGALSFLKALLNMIIGIIVSVYLLSSKELLAGQCKKVTYALMNRDRANAFIHNIRFIHKTFLGFFGGKIIDSLIIGMICFILMTIMRLPFAVLISMIIGVTNIIPYFGPFIGAIPSAFLILLAEPNKCLPFVIMIVILQQFDGNILGPKILGQSTGLSSFWVIFAITVFGGYFGFLGMLVGVPIFAVLYAGFMASVNGRLEKQNLTTVTKKYVHVDYIDDDAKFISLSKDNVTNVVNRKSFRDLFILSGKNKDQEDGETREVSGTHEVTGDTVDLFETRAAIQAAEKKNSAVSERTNGRKRED